MIATQYNIYSWDSYNKLYLSHYGRFGESGDYTYVLCDREKANIRVTTSNNSTHPISNVTLYIGEYSTSYIMPDNGILDIDITDLMRLSPMQTLSVDVTISSDDFYISSYQFKIAVTRGYIYTRFLRKMNLCKEYYSINKTTGINSSYLILLPDEPILPYTIENKRKFPFITFWHIIGYMSYGMSNVTITQDGISINDYTGQTNYLQVNLERSRPFRKWVYTAVGSQYKTSVPRAMSDKGVFLYGLFPFAPLITSKDPKNLLRFAFFFDLYEIENDVQETSLMSNAVSSPYFLENKVKIKIGAKNISINDYVIYSTILLSEDINVVFDETINNLSTTSLSINSGYKAKLISKDFVTPIGDEKVDFIVELLINY